MRTTLRPFGGWRMGAPALALAVLAALAAASAGAATPGTDPTAFARNVNLARGATRDALSFGVDRVNPFNGNLSIVLPVGAPYPVSRHFSYELALSYNSQAWDFTTSGAAGSTLVAAQPAAASNAGFGWDLSLGRLFAPSAAGNADQHWVFVAPDGRRHLFYDSLFGGALVAPESLYSRDGSYLRLDAEPGGTQAVRWPDGRFLRFAPQGQGWVLERVGDHRGAYLDSTYSPDGSTWTLTDLHGREQVVVFAADPSGTYERLVDEVRLTAFGGATAVYDLHYVTATVERPESDDDPATPANRTLPLLARIDLPDGTSYELGYHAAKPLDSGLLASLRLPTRGEVRWSYAQRVFPWLSCAAGANRHLVDVAGVAGRHTLDAGGAVDGTWSFAAELDPPRPKSSTCDQPRELAVTVTSPLGHRQRQYFSVYVSGPTGAEGWRFEEYGLPFTRRFQDASGLFLSRQVFDGEALMRGTRVGFEEDVHAGCGGCFERNHRLAARRTVFHDDAGHWVETQLQGYDGYGTYTTSIASSSFHGELVTTEVATVERDHDAWLLGLVMGETRSRGAETEIARHCLDAHGDRVRTRRLAGVAEGEHDLLTVHQLDALGNRMEKALYGGDVQSLPTTADPCAVALPSPLYRQLTTWADGGVESQRWVDSEGATVLTTSDQDVDPSTGLFALRRDVSGLATSYLYDAAARQIRAVQPDGSILETTYEAAAPGVPAAEVTAWRDAGGNLLSEERTTFDAFGRPASVTVPTVSGGSAAESWERDGEGNVVGWSDRLGKTTHYLDHDPFGRPRVERPPTGAADERTYTYQGERVVLEHWRAGLYFSEPFAELVQGTKWARRTYDSAGRQIEAASHGGDVGRMTYDVAGRLVRSSHFNPVDAEHVLFERDYDGRGFLVETTDGDGETTAFAGYDPLGQLSEQTTPYGTVLQEFDGAGRLVRVRDGAGRLLKELEYAAANGAGDYRKGKLHRAVRYNHDMVDVDNPLVVTETLFYEQPGGRPSRHRLTVAEGGVTRQTFWSAATWDALGQPASYEYPHCNGGWRLDCSSQQRVVESVYHPTNRRHLFKLRSRFNGGPAEDFAKSIGYFDDGRLESIFFGGGPLMYQLFVAHPELPGRYSRESICTQASCQHFDPLVYDGDGRLVRQVLGPVMPDERRSLPTGPPAPASSRPSRAELLAALDDGAAPPPCPVVTRDALGKVTKVDRCGGDAEPRYLYHAYDAQDRRLWTVGSTDGVHHTTWESRWELRDLSGRTVRRYERLSNNLTQIEDLVYAGDALVGFVRSWSSQSGEGERFYVHTDLAGRPHSKHRVENGQIVEWSAW